MQKISTGLIKKIGSSAFWGCENLTYVSLNDVSEIEQEAFALCEKLETVLGLNCEYLPQEIFAGCSSLKQVVLDDGINTIGLNAFQGCTSLASFTISKNIESIEKNAFKNCSNLTELVIKSKTIYNNLGSDTDLSLLVNNLTTVKVLKTIDDQTCAYLNECFTRDTETDPDYYNIYTKQ